MWLAQTWLGFFAYLGSRARLLLPWDDTGMQPVTADSAIVMKGSKLTLFSLISIRLNASDPVSVRQSATSPAAVVDQGENLGSR